MDKVVIAAVCALIGVSIWAVMPAETPTTAPSSNDARGDNAASNVRGTTPSDTSRMRSDQASEGTRPTSAVARNGAEVVRRNLNAKDARKIDVTESINAQVFNENPVAPQVKNQEPTVEDQEQGKSRFADVHWDGEVDYHDLEDALMKLYSKRTVGKGLPANIVAEQVLPESVLEELRVQPNTRVLMIGDFPPNEERSVVETLKRARQGEFETGFTFDDPNMDVGGRRVYIKVLLN